MTERFWTPERKKDYHKLAAAREHRRKYIRNTCSKSEQKETSSTGGNISEPKVKVMASARVYNFTMAESDHDRSRNNL